jgi:hypothetical protein
MADWKSFEVNVPGEDLLESTRSTLEQLLIYMDILKSILNTIDIFLVDFGNPLRVLVEMLLREIEEVFLALKASQASALFHVPRPSIDPNFQLCSGYGSFTQVFKQSLLDSSDHQRPQPRKGSTKGGYVLLVTQANSPYELMSRVQNLLRFFNREFTSPRYESPRNLKVIPATEDLKLITDVASIFSESPRRVAITWNAPTSEEVPDPGFSDLVNRVAHEAVIPQYLIEKSTIDPFNARVDISDIKNPEKSGVVEFGRDVSIAGTLDQVVKREILLDCYGDPVVKFTENIIIDRTSLTGLLGNLGTYRYYDSDVTTGVDYYYRVRALSGEPRLDANGQIDWEDPVSSDGRDVPRVIWPSSSDTVVPGKATPVSTIRLTEPIEGFDVLTNIENVLLSSFSLDFHRSKTTTNQDFVGISSMLGMAGMVALKEFYALYADLSAKKASGALGGVSGITFPWDNLIVRRQSLTLADEISSCFLSGNEGLLYQFRDLMQKGGEDSLESRVAAAVESSSSYLDLVTDVISDSGTSKYQGGLAELYLSNYESDSYRTDLLQVIDLFRSVLGTGLAPDWVSVSPLRDIVPWSGQMLYELIAKIESLYESSAGVVDELNGFIDLLTRKIETLERTLEFLISLLDLVARFKIGAYCLYVPEIDGDVTDWIAALDNAGGAKPPDGTDGYSAGVALAYVAPDVKAFTTAFSLIFGG